MQYLLGFGMLLRSGRVRCWLKGSHRYTESLIGYEPSLYENEYIWFTYHFNCLRCPKAYTHSRKVPVDRRHAA